MLGTGECASSASESTIPSCTSSSWRSGTYCRQRSEEHTSELQSRLHLVCRLLLEKKQLLREHAPAWLIQLPWLVERGELHDLRAGLSGTTPERMLRVFAQLVEELTNEVTLVLVL